MMTNEVRANYCCMTAHALCALTVIPREAGIITIAAGAFVDSVQEIREVFFTVRCKGRFDGQA